jgi:flagellin-like protein
MSSLHDWIERAAQGIEALAVLIMVAFILVGTVGWLLHSRLGVETAYPRYRVVLGKTLLVGLELLVAADIIRTVALDTTLLNITTLGALVVVRTFLSWTLTVEVEGRWPWQTGASPEEPRD